MLNFSGIIGLVGFLILIFLMVSKAGGAESIFNSLASSGKTLITTLQGRK